MGAYTEGLHPTSRFNSHTGDQQLTQPNRPCTRVLPAASPNYKSVSRSRDGVNGIGRGGGSQLDLRPYSCSLSPFASTLCACFKRIRYMKCRGNRNVWPSRNVTLKPSLVCSMPAMSRSSMSQQTRISKQKTRINVNSAQNESFERSGPKLTGLRDPMPGLRDPMLRDPLQ